MCCQWSGLQLLKLSKYQFSNGDLDVLSKLLVDVGADINAQCACPAYLATAILIQLKEPHPSSLTIMNVKPRAARQLQQLLFAAPGSLKIQETRKTRIQGPYLCKAPTESFQQLQASSFELDRSKMAFLGEGCFGKVWRTNCLATKELEQDRLGDTSYSFPSAVLREIGVLNLALFGHP